MCSVAFLKLSLMRSEASRLRQGFQRCQFLAPMRFALMLSLCGMLCVQRGQSSSHELPTLEDVNS